MFYAGNLEKGKQLGEEFNSYAAYSFVKHLNNKKAHKLAIPTGSNTFYYSLIITCSSKCSITLLDFNLAEI